jgi:peptidoglycan/LPS O-acetylase OafA/YrhL
LPDRSVVTALPFANAVTATSLTPVADDPPSPAAARPSFAYQPALDGVRAVSVLLVLLFHAGLAFVPAGYLGVSVFFTLSGYLITSLLLSEWSRSGAVDVGGFYGRRVRRLLPASTVCIVAVVIARRAGAFTEVSDFRSDVIGAALQVFNWVQLAGSGSYGDLFGSASSPLEHYWSLSIEEQFYWVWPVVVLAALRLAARRPGRDTRRRLTWALGAVTGLAAVAAPVVAVVWGPDAAYWATPARLAEILAGALVAALLHRRTVPAAFGRLAAPALVAILVASMVLPSDRGPAYQGWLPVFALASATLVVALQVDGMVRRALSWRPLVAVGAISYGLYLFHWPVFVLLRERGWDLATPGGLVVALAVTAAVSVASYRLVERPIRHASWTPRASLGLAAAATTAALVGALLVPATRPVIRADEVLLDRAAIAPADPDGSLAPLLPVAPADPAGAADSPVVTIPAVSTPAGSPPSSEPVGGGTTRDDATATTPVPGTTPSTGSVAPAAPSVPPATVELPPAPSRPVRLLVAGDSTALYIGQGLAAWSTTVPDHAQVSVTWCQACTFLLEPEIVSIELDGLLESSRRAVLEALPEAIDSLRPDVVVMMATVTEVSDRRWSDDEGAIGPLDARFRERMVDAYADLTMSLLQRGVPEVVWVVPPTPVHLWREPALNERARYEAHHEIIREAVGRFERHVSVLDLDAWATATGAAQDPDWRRDGVHIDEGPALRLATDMVGPWLVTQALTPGP